VASSPGRPEGTAIVATVIIVTVAILFTVAIFTGPRFATAKNSVPPKVGIVYSVAIKVESSAAKHCFDQGPPTR